MDKTPEANSSSENLQIPENWKFPERDEQDLKPIQIDNEARFLAFTLPDGRGLKSIEYFFDVEGEVSNYCITPYIASISIGLTTDTRAVYDVYRYVHFGASSEVIDINILFKSSDLSDATIEDRLGNVASLYGNVSLINVDSVFLKQPEEGKKIESPRFGLNIKDGEINFSVTDTKERHKETNEYIVDNFVIRKKEDEAAEVFDKDGKRVFDIDWRTEEGDKEEGRGQFLVINQTHLPTGIVKTLRAPLTFDLSKIAENLSARPPYDKEKIRGREILVIPWRNIDRIVGASLSYSYPPPPNKVSRSAGN